LKASVKYLIALVILLADGGLWLYYNAQADVMPLQQNTPLTMAVYDCEAITEKAAANLVAVVEFQKLEIIGRKARVFKLCMQDHGYTENPAWTTFAAPVAAQIAKAEHSSVDEAFENLRRAKMVLAKPSVNEPLFWKRS
jgi:hypothetical protein